MDVWGPYSVPTVDGYKFFLTLVDDHSQAIWVYLMKHKSEVYSHIENFYNMVYTQFGIKIKIFHSGLF